MISKELLEILACSVCKEKIDQDESREVIVCHKCRMKYPYRDGIAFMLLEESSPLED